MRFPLNMVKAAWADAAPNSEFGVFPRLYANDVMIFAGSYIYSGFLDVMSLMFDRGYKRVTFPSLLDYLEKYFDDDYNRVTTLPSDIQKVDFV